MPPASRGWSISLQRLHSICTLPRTRQFAKAASHNQASATSPLKIQLRKYQEECIQAVLGNLREGHKRLGISLATGAGKTIIFTQLIDRVEPPSEVATQTLILAHRQELVEQAARHCTNAYPTKTIEIEMGLMHASGSADITVASVQSIISGDRISKFDPYAFKLVLVDEAHHIVAPGYMKILDYFGLSTAQKGSPALVGVSATLSRFDGVRLGAALDQIVYHKDYIDMIGENWLSDVLFTTVQSKVDISRVKKGANGDFQPSELSQVVNTDQVNEITVRSWLAKAQGRKSTLVFCVDLAHVAGLTNKYREHGIEAQYVTSTTPKQERSSRLDSFRNGEFPVLVNCGVFTEGTDIPNIDCVLLARPTKSRNLLVQMIGRGMRLHPGKKDCHVIDMVASLETGIVTTPTLFGLDPSELVDEARVEDMKGLKTRHEEAIAQRRTSQSTPSCASIPRTITFTEYESVYDLIADTSEERHIRALSPLAWVCVSRDKYVLTNSSGSYIRIEKETAVQTIEEYLVTETVALRSGTSKSPYMKPRLVARCETFANAVHAADTFAQSKYPFQLISRNQIWRNGPASDSQLMFLNKLRPKDEQLTSHTLTKGKAGDMITKLKHGARGRFADFEADRKRMGRIKLRLEQEQVMKEREQVSIGPLKDWA